MKRLTPAFLTILMLGVVGLLVALYVAKNILGRETPVVEDEIVNIPMALTDLKPGTLVTEGHVGLGRARQSKISADVIRTNRVVVGRVVKTEIKAATPISTFDLYPPNERPPLQVTPGMVALTIPVASSTSLADGQTQPGEYVDVHFTPASVPGISETGGMTMTLFKGVKVLAVNGNATSAAASRGNNTVTLELAEQNSNVMLLAKDKGAIDLVFNPNGKGNDIIAVEDKHRTTLDQILGLKQPEEEKVITPFVTEIYMGSGRRTQLFRDGTHLDVYSINNPRTVRSNFGRAYNNGNALQPSGGNAAMPYFEQVGGSYYSVPGGTGNGQPATNGNGNPNGGNQGGGLNQGNFDQGGQGG